MDFDIFFTFSPDTGLRYAPLPNRSELFASATVAAREPQATCAHHAQGDQRFVLGLMLLLPPAHFVERARSVARVLAVL